MIKDRKMLLIGIICFCVILAVIARPCIQGFTATKNIICLHRLKHNIKFLYENGKRGRAIFNPSVGSDIIFHSTENKKKTLPIMQKKNAVTYGLSGGRLGDNLLSYLHAKWVAYCENVPLIIKHFPRDDDFELINEAVFASEEPVIEIPYFPEPSMKNNNPPFTVDWDDPGFRKEIAKCLKPTRKHTLLELPKDCITICVHVRRGGTFDPPSLYYEYPLKFPPDSFFIDQIKTIAFLFKDKPLYVFLMTDDLHPEDIMDRYKKAVGVTNIQWNYRQKPPENDLDDFYSIPLFDCLILGDSNFSIAASKLSEYAIIISPTHYKKKKGKVKITGLDIAFNPGYKKER